MRAATVLGVCLLSGCLYVGGINHAPEGQLQLEQSSARLEKLGSATLRAQVSDRDGEVHVATIDNRSCWLTDLSGGSNCEGASPIAILTGTPEGAGRLSLNNLPFRGTYRVTLRVADEEGADARSEYTFEVKNQPPREIKVLVIADGRFDDQVPDHDGGYPGHAHYLARIAETSDYPEAERDLRCGQKASVVWSLSHPASIQPLYRENKPCNPNEVLDRHRFRFAPGSITAPTRVTVRARVSDGYGATVEGTRELTLLPNRAACIQSADPSVDEDDKVREEVRVLHDDPSQTFSVGVVDDDVPPEQGYTYVWQVDDGKGFLTLPDQSGEVFELPQRFRAPGDTIQLRVVVQDAAAGMPGCSSDTALCAADKRLPKKCYQWVTWKVRFL
jgi:hypothetical protein